MLCNVSFPPRLFPTLAFFSPASRCVSRSAFTATATSSRPWATHLHRASTRASGRTSCRRRSATWKTGASSRLSETAGETSHEKRSLCWPHVNSSAGPFREASVCNNRSQQQSTSFINLFVCLSDYYCSFTHHVSLRLFLNVIWCFLSISYLFWGLFQFLISNRAIL